MDRLTHRITLTPEYELAFTYDIEAARNSPTDGVSNLDIYWFPEVPESPSPKLVAAFDRALKRFTSLVQHATGQSLTIVCDFGRTPEEHQRELNDAVLQRMETAGST